MEEGDLIQLIKQQPEKFELLFNQFYHPILNYTFRRTGKFDTSRDITSEVFLAFPRYKWKGIPIKFWLFRIAGNEINLYYRSKKYAPILVEETYGISYLDKQSAALSNEKLLAEQQMKENEHFNKVRSAVEALPIHHQQVISLKYFEQLRITEIAIVLKKKEGTIKSLLFRGKKLLKQHLEMQPDH